MRRAEVERLTAETKVRVELVLDGTGEYRIRTGVPFFDHLLAQWARHGRFDLTVEAVGDLAVDAHHTVEDVGIGLGEAFRKALGDGAGIARFSSLHAAMDEALVLCAVDISGRSYLHYDVPFPAPSVGSFPTELVEEFWRAFTANARITLHLLLLHGRNAHHIAEALFKGCGVVLAQAVRVVGTGIPSTKGVL